MKFNKFVAKHKVLALILINAVEFSLLALLCYLKVSGVTGAIVWGVILLLVNLLLAWAVESALLDGPIKMLDNYCDPDELYNMTTELLSYNLKEKKRLVVLMDHATVLSAMAEYEKACSILEGINPAKLGGAIHIVMIYNYNLANMYMALERFDEAKTLFDTAEQLYGCIKEGKFKNSLAGIMKNAKLYNHYCKGEYDEVIKCSGEVSNVSLRHSLSAAFICAEVYLKLGEKEKAREKLNYVNAYGNRLHIAKQAKMLLEETK